MILTGENRSTRRKTCFVATLSTINPTRTGLKSNTGLSVEKPATNRLSGRTVDSFQILYAFEHSPSKHFTFTKFDLFSELRLRKVGQCRRDDMSYIS